jgi:hypothetical protein
LPYQLCTLLGGIYQGREGSTTPPDCGEQGDDHASNELCTNHYTSFSIFRSGRFTRYAGLAAPFADLVFALFFFTEGNNYIITFSIHWRAP